jgi:hypothetical protein
VDEVEPARRLRPGSRVEPDRNGRWVLVGEEEFEDMVDGVVIVVMPPDGRCES